MTELEDAMYEHMAYLNFSKGESFYFGNFLDFEVDGRQHTPNYGTIRNIFSKFRRQGKIKVYCNSKPVFFQLTESNLGKKSMTLTHMGGIPTVISHNDPFYNRLKTLPMGKQSIHDIRIRLTVPNIYEALAINSTFPQEDYSGDIRLPLWNVDNATVQVRIHRTNTVSVILACSQEPFLLDYSGILAFFTTLGRVHGFLSAMMLCIYSQDVINNHCIPSLSDWLVTMWHFGRDSLIEYSGGAHVTIERAQNILERLYPKVKKGKHILRHEFVEYPNKLVFDAIEEKLNLDTTTSFISQGSQLPNLGTESELVEID